MEANGLTNALLTGLYAFLIFWVLEAVYVVFGKCTETVLCLAFVRMGNPEWCADRRATAKI
jgi:hypothetical protein